MRILTFPTALVGCVSRNGPYVSGAGKACRSGLHETASQRDSEARGSTSSSLIVESGPLRKATAPSCGKARKFAARLTGFQRVTYLKLPASAYQLSAEGANTMRPNHTLHV